MNLVEWRARRVDGEPFTLPSGLEVHLRRVSMLDLVEQGKVPETLQPQLQAMNDQAKKGDLKISQVIEFAQVVNLVCRACMVVPEGLPVEELPLADRIAIMTWANEAAGKLAPFRRPAAEPVDAAQSGGDVRAAAKPLAGVGGRQLGSVSD